MGGTWLGRRRKDLLRSESFGVILRLEVELPLVHPALTPGALSGRVSD